MVSDVFFFFFFGPCLLSFGAGPYGGHYRCLLVRQGIFPPGVEHYAQLQKSEVGLGGEQPQESQEISDEELEKEEGELEEELEEY
jgi:hypothetical protein